MKAVIHNTGINIILEHIRKTIALLFLTFVYSQHASALATAGWVEYGYIMPESFVMRAKLDTGADTTSMNANNIEFFSKDGSDWVRFSVKNFKHEKLVIARPIARTAMIKRHHGNSQDRPVIELTLCIDGINKTVDVSLVDRSKFKYQLLIGRNFMRNSLLVDSARKYILPDRCTPGPSPGGLVSENQEPDSQVPDD